MCCWYGSIARRIRPARCRGAACGRSALLLAFVLIAGCRIPEQDTLSVTDAIPLPEDGFTSLALVDDGGAWVGGTAGVMRVGADGETLARAELPTGHEYRLLAEPGVGLVAAAPSIVARIDGATGDVLAVAMGDFTAPFRLDPAGRFLLTSGAAGAIVAHDLDGLEPRWGWAAVGAPGTALALLPRGERIFHATGGGEETPLLLYRDVQTGTTLRSLERAEPTRALETAADGGVYGVAWREGAGGSVFALGWSEGNLGEEWATTLAALDLPPPLTLRIAPSGRLLAVFGRANESGLRVLDTETGGVRERYSGAVLDAGFDSGDRLVILVPGELRRIE